MYRARASRRSCRRPAAPAAVHPLERRDLLTTFVVTTTADAGPGSLREAILMANAAPTTDDVRFNIPGDGLYHTIAPLSPLPEILSPLVIDGRTQPGYLSSPVIEISGALAGAGVDGLTVAAPQSAVRGLAINRFDGHGVVLAGFRPPSATLPAAPGGTNARVEACYIGTDLTGNVALPNSGAGIRVSASGAIIGSATIAPIPPVPVLPATSGRNVISGNGFAGVWIAPGPTPGPAVNGTTLVNNYIGTNAAGNRGLGNGREGVLIEAPGMVQIGSPTPVAPSQPATRNVISGNGASGIRVGFVSAGPMVTIQNNYIGTDASGANAIGNGQNPTQLYRDGVTVSAQATVRVGVPQQGMRNVISGNAGAGVAVYMGTDVQVIGNFIGTDATGNADLGNGGDGVLASGASSTARVTGNVISGNGGDGVRAVGNQRQVTVSGNYIGTNATGTSALGNAGDGVELSDVAPSAIVGGSGSPNPPVGTTPPPVLSPTSTGRNIISANGGNGVHVNALGTVFARPQVVAANYIGTDYTGTVPLGNAGSGIYLAASGVVVGGSSGQGNVIAANGVNGITIVGPLSGQVNVGPAPTRIESNRIGVGAPPRTSTTTVGDAGMGNRHHGIAILYSSNNRIGGANLTSGNVIAYNGGSGVMVQGSSVAQTNSPQAAEGNLITANSIYDNGRLGIDLVAAGEGVTPNDMRDADTGPNRLQNHPVITEAVGVPGSSSVSGRFTLHAEPGKTYRVEIFASLAPDPTGRGEGQSYVTGVNVNTDAGGNATGVFFGSHTLPSSRTTTPYPVFVTATATEMGRNNTSEFSPAVRTTPPQPNPVPLPQGAAQVVGRHAFYNNSAFDAAGGDDAAIATDKRARLPGVQPSFDNVTSFSRGLNGIMVDIAGLPAGATLTPDEFEARGTGPSGAFEVAARPFAVSVRRGAGVNGSDRVTLYWSDNLPTPGGVAPAVLNGWLEVKVLASAVTGLAAPDVFSFGNLAGETGNASSGALRVDTFDFARTRAAAMSGGAASVTSRFDHNRDGVVDAEDVAVVRANFARPLAAPTAPPVDGGAVAAAPSRSAYRPSVAGRIAEDLLV